MSRDSHILVRLLSVFVCAIAALCASGSAHVSGFCPCGTEPGNAMACIAEQSVVNTDDDGECSNSLDEEKPMAALSAAEMPIGSVLRPVQPTNVLFGGARLCGGHKSLGAQRAGVVVPCVALGLTKAFRPYIHASGSCYAIALRHIIR